ncbi:hypothetical protein LDENG_00228970 [Lucifuga dentata]|nr:hypothetical protein LDENG_00228970 [Lucifuga dentata]
MTAGLFNKLDPSRIRKERVAVMRGNRKSFADLCLLLCCMLSVEYMICHKVPQAKALTVVMDMAEDSVDDISFRKDLLEFGVETCFKIRTCSGAFLKHYTHFFEVQEVLIPPYEKFKITKILHDEDIESGLRHCKVLYVLKHAGIRSKLNCRVVRISAPLTKKKEKGFLSLWKSCFPRLGKQTRR